MRRLEFLEAIDNVQHALSESHALEFLNMFSGSSRPDKEHAGPAGDPRMAMEAMTVFQKYSVAASSFGTTENKVIEMFNLDVVGEPEFWTTLMFGHSPGLQQKADLATLGFSQIKKLQGLLAPEEVMPPGAPPKGAGRTVEKLSILVIEEKGHLSRPARLVNVLQGVTSLYDTHALLLDLPLDSLLVAACDSGSDKAFDFLGVAKAIQAVKDTILSLWDRVVFFRERKLVVQLQLVAEALPVLAEISSLAERKAIGPEQAEILRRQVITGASQLVEAGAIMPDLTTGHLRGIRALAAPEPKLLAAPEPPLPEPATEHRPAKTKRRKQS